MTRLRPLAAIVRHTIAATRNLYGVRSPVSFGPAGRARGGRSGPAGFGSVGPAREGSVPAGFESAPGGIVSPTATGGARRDAPRAPAPERGPRYLRRPLRAV